MTTAIAEKPTVARVAAAPVTAPAAQPPVRKPRPANRDLADDLLEGISLKIDTAMSMLELIRFATAAHDVLNEIQHRADRDEDFRASLSKTHPAWASPLSNDRVMESVSALAEKAYQDLFRAHQDTQDALHAVGSLVEELQR